MAREAHLELRRPGKRHLSDDPFVALVVHHQLLRPHFPYLGPPMPLPASAPVPPGPSPGPPSRIPCSCRPFFSLSSPRVGAPDAGGRTPTTPDQQAAVPPAEGSDASASLPVCRLPDPSPGVKAGLGRPWAEGP